MAATRAALSAAVIALLLLPMAGPAPAAGAGPSAVWLDGDFGLRFVVFVNETTGADKGRVVVDVWLDLTDLGIANATDEVRVARYDASGGREVEIPFQVAGERNDGEASYEARVVFETSPLAAGSSQRYHIYARCPGAERSPLFTEFRPDLIKNRAVEPGYENNNYDFAGPTDVDVSTDGRIFVVDRGNHRVQVFDSDGGYLRTIGKPMTPGSGNGSLSFPTGIALTPDYILVADTGNHRVQVFDSGYGYVATLGETGVPGSDASHLNGPKDVSVDGVGKVYVTDFGNHRVQIFDHIRAGAATLTIGKTGVPGSGNDELRCPYGVSVRAGKVFVSDSSNHRIQVFTQAGEYMYTLGEPGVIGSDQDRFYYPYGISATCDGCLAVADFKNHRVQIFNQTSAYCMTVGVALSPGSGNTLLHDPSSVKLEGDILYVADTHNNRVQFFSATTGDYLRTLGLRPLPEDFETRFYDPRDVTVADDGTIFVSDRLNNRVQAFSSDMEYLFTLGTALESGAEDTHLSKPYDVDVTSDLIAVADSGNNRIQLFSRDGVYLDSLTGGGGESFVSPCGVKIDEDGGRILVADTYKDRLFVFGSDHSFIRIVEGGDPRFTAVYGTGSPTFRHPYDVDIASDGDVYVLDTDNLCVQVLDGSNYSFKRTLFEGVEWDPAIDDWVGGGQRTDQLQWPCGFDIDGSVIRIADTYNDRVISVALDGSLVSVLGTQAGANDDFVYPRGVGVGPGGRIYVADSNNNRIQVFEADGTFVRTVGTPGIFVYDTFHLYSPEGVCVLPDGSFLVADTNNHRVMKFGRLGEPQFTIGGAASREPGSDNEHLDSPSDVAVGNDRIYVSDKGNGRIQVFHLNGAFDRTIDVDCYGLDVGLSGRLYVADAPEHCVRVLTSDGTPVATLGTPSVSGSDLSHLNFPIKVAVADDGKVYVADSMNHRVAVYNDLADNVIDSSIGVAGSSGSDSSRLNNPHGLLVTGSRVYIADTGNHRIQVFDRSGLYLNTLGATGKASLSNAQFNGPQGVSADGYGTVYVADTLNQRIVRVADVGIEVAGIERMELLEENGDSSALALIAVTLLLILLAAGTSALLLRRLRPKGPSLPRGWGIVYVSRGGRADKAYDAFRRLRKGDGMRTLLVSRAAPHQLEESYGIEVGEMVWLSRVESDIPGVQSMSPRPLPPLLDRISTFITEEKGDVVMLDGIELLITENDFDSVLKFLDSLMPLVSQSKAILVMPVHPDTMSKQEFSLLAKGMHVMD